MKKRKFQNSKYNISPFIPLDASLYCPTSVIVTANVSQEKPLEKNDDEDEVSSNKIGKHSKYNDRLIIKNAHFCQLPFPIGWCHLYAIHMKKGKIYHE